MDHKLLKQDLTYAIKKLIKNDYHLDQDGGGLDFVNGKIVLNENGFDPIESLILIRDIKLDSYEEDYDIETGITTILSEPKNPDCYVFNEKLSYNLNVSSIVEKYLNISSNELESFYNGFEMVDVPIKDEYYKIGLFIREKFLTPTYTVRQPVGKPKSFIANTDDAPLFTKFVIHQYKKITYIRQVECCLVLDFLSKKDEWRAKILDLHMRELDKNNNLVEPIWCWFAFHDSTDSCLKIQKENIFNGIIHSKRKAFLKEGGDINEFSFSEEDVNKEVDDTLSKIQVVYLK